MPSIVIVGASRDPAKFSRRALVAYHELGWTVFPVHPGGGEIDGLLVYRTLDEVPERPVDRISMYVPPSVGRSLLPAIAALGCKELWLNPGSGDDLLVSEAEALGLNVIEACSIVAVGADPHG